MYIHINTSLNITNSSSTLLFFAAPSCGVDLEDRGHGVVIAATGAQVLHGHHRAPARGTKGWIKKNHGMICIYGDIGDLLGEFLCDLCDSWVNYRGCNR